jgi:hypothetical protein
LFGKVTLALNLTFSPRRRNSQRTSSFYPVTCPANPLTGISKDAGNMKILSWGRGNR